MFSNYGLSCERSPERTEALEAFFDFEDLSLDNLLGLFIKKDLTLFLVESTLVNCLNAGTRVDLWGKIFFLPLLLAITAYVPRHKQQTRITNKIISNIIIQSDKRLASKII